MIKNYFIAALSIVSFERILSIDASIILNEIAFKGSRDGTCGSEDWIELLNTDLVEAVDLTGYVLHDDEGKESEEAMVFPSATIAPGRYIVLCKERDFLFGIGTDDTISLLDATGDLVDSVSLPGVGTDDETFAYVDGEYEYTTTPTPGFANIYTERESMEEQLEAQNEEANSFFRANYDRTFDKVVDIQIFLDEKSLAVIKDHPSWEKYVDFNELSVTTTDGATVLATSSEGKIRTKGAWTKHMTICMGHSNIPFMIKFDTPFLGMETVYLRNHQDDNSFMRDHASHTMLKEFGLPYLRTRPVRVFLNGSYAGFYVLMEAPTQAYVMQRSFGKFKPEETALFKVKPSVKNCPYDISEISTVAKSSGATNGDKYYFERGDHRADIPALGPEGYNECIGFYFEEDNKNYEEEVRGFLEYEEDCGLAMVKMGIVERDFGSKDTEAPMVDFLNLRFYNEESQDLADSVDIDQWLQNMAVYAIVLNMDSPMSQINNFYMATTDGGKDDWKLFQYDHQGITSKTMIEFGCDASCSPRMVYWPILRPTCGSVEKHPIVGQLLNSDENIQKYLGYVQDYVTILAKSTIIEDLYDYGNSIKEFVAEDPWNQYPTVEAYEESELGTNIEDYNTNERPFLKTLQVRVQQVQKQLDVIKEGTLPADGVYDEEAICPDWRDGDSKNYVLASASDGEVTKSAPHSGTFMESETCSFEPSSECAAAANCFDHMSGICAFDGEILTVECQVFLPSCKPCFPYSRCGSGTPPDIPMDGSDTGSDTVSGADDLITKFRSRIFTVVVAGLSWIWSVA